MWEACITGGELFVYLSLDFVVSVIGDSDGTIETYCHDSMFKDYVHEW